MKRYLQILLLTALFPFTAAAEDIDIDALIENRQYLSAWTTVHDQADQMDFADMMIRKAELSLHYYVMSNMHQAFAFRDLEKNEDLAELRKSRASGEMKLFDPAGGLAKAVELSPERGDLFFWLGEYYHEVRTIYGSSWHIGEDELGALAINNYRKALELGEKSEKLYANLAYEELLTGDFAEAAEHLNAALNYAPENPGYLNNKAIALMNGGQYDEAMKAVLSAEDFYTEPRYKADSFFLASTISLYLGDSLSAERYLNKGESLSPKDYRFADRLIRLHLAAGDYEKARGAAGRLFALYPENPENCSTILQYFYGSGRLEESDLFFEEQLAVYTEQPAIRGNLHYHRAAAFKYRGLKEEAVSSLEKAEREFQMIHPSNHPVFKAMDAIREEMRAD